MSLQEKLHQDNIRKCEAIRSSYLNEYLPPNPFKTSPEEEARLKEQAKNFPVTRLPYRGPRRYSNVQFGRRMKVVRADSGIAYNDFERMHVFRRGGNAEQWVPEFANNDTDLQLVLAQSAWDYCHRGRVPDEFVKNLGDLKQLVDAFFEKYASEVRGQAPRRRIESIEGQTVVTTLACDEQYNNHRTHAILIKQAGGYLERDAAVAYQSWRLRRQSTTVGEELRLTPSLVRHILSGLCETARRLGFEATSPRANSRGKIRRYRPNNRIAKLPQAAELVRLVESGLTFEQIREKFGVMHVVAVKNAFYHSAKRIVSDNMRTNGATWDEIDKRFQRIEERFSFAEDLRRFLCRDAGLCECGCGTPTPIAKMTERAKGRVKGLPLQFLKYHDMRVRRRVTPSRQ